MSLYLSTLNLTNQNIPIQLNVNPRQQKIMNGTLSPIDDLKIIKRIGKGGFSEVFQAIDNQTNKQYAVRLCKIDNKTYTFERAFKEIEICK